MKKKTILLISLIVTIIILSPYSVIRKGVMERDVTKNKNLALEKLHEDSEHLVEKINQTFEHIEAIELIMYTNPDNLDIIQEYAKMVSKKHNTIANIAIAPNGIVEYIYPLEGNEGAVNHNLMEDPDRKYFIKKSIREKRSIIQGPVEAVQGGILVFNRKPIFVKGNKIEEFWGFISMAVDFEELIKDAGISTEDPDYLYRVRALNSNGFEDYVWGNLKNEDSISNRISFENQEWEIGLYPRDGWKNKGDYILNLENIDMFFIVLSLILFIVIYNHLNQYQQHSEEARLDTMTGTLNRDTFLSLVKNNLLYGKGRKQGFIIIDINNFKNINDSYGHMVGDFVIVEFSRRLLKCHRNKDLVARWGGDEFTVYLNLIDSEEHMKGIVTRIKKAIEPPFVFDDISLKVKAAIGYALYPIDGLEFEDLYKKADIMMYDNKVKEKNP